MSKYRFYMLLSALISVLSIYALDCKSGELKSLVDNPGAMTSLTLKGEIDASDLRFIATEMPSLKTLDLREAVIVKLRENKTLYPAATIPTMIFADAPFSTIVLPEQKNLIVEEAAFTGSKLTAVTIPATVKKVGTGAFAGCDNLKKATLNAVTIFAGDVFNGCAALEEADLGGASKITTSMFGHCPGLKTVAGAQAVTAIGDKAFVGDLALKSFDFPATLQTIGSEAFMHTSLTEANLEGCTSLQSVGERAFSKIGTLKSAMLPGSVTTLGSGAFAMNPSLTDVKLSTSIATIPDYAFTSTPGVNAGDVIHDEVREIGAYALKGHDTTAEVTIPYGVTYIGDHAMEGMTALTTVDVTAHTTVPELGNDVWAGVDQSKVELKVGDHMASSFRNAAQWQDFSIIDPTVGIVDATATAQEVKARFVGATLEIASTTADIAEVELYNTSGQMLVRLTPGVNRVEINTGAWAENIYIATVRLTSGTRATAKLMRL